MEQRVRISFECPVSLRKWLDEEAEETIPDVKRSGRKTKRSELIRQILQAAAERRRWSAPRPNPATRRLAERLLKLPKEDRGLVADLGLRLATGDHTVLRKGWDSLRNAHTRGSTTRAKRRARGKRTREKE